MFEGFTIIIEIEKVIQWLKKNAAWIDTSWLSEEKFKSRTEPVTIIANKSEIWHLAEGFYSELTEKSKSFRIIKVLELFEQISGHIGETKPVEYYSAAVTKATTEVYSYLSQNPTKKVTIDEMCNMFSISKTSLQCCFKSIYGTTPASYIRSERMKYAAQLIVSESHKSIGEIAAEIGYDNASKFSAAFRAVMNECPLEYRRRNTCSHCIDCNYSEKTE
ncbi:MAG: AraC family transcriptional regulator [Lachnospiraceae bacterium]|nr:AraC family transcriptional regulator [Lachnospiraceae bacterium]